MPETLALHGGTPVCSRPPAAPWPDPSEAERQALAEAHAEGGWGGHPSPGPRAGAFATRFAAAHDARHGICAANGSITLEIALDALGVESGDEVIVPVYTWIATAGCAVRCNAVPVFVDVEPRTWCIDPDAVEAAVTERTRAVVAVHLGASMADLDRLGEIAERRGLALVEDCAHAHGARWRGRGAGSWGACGSFSFQSSKLMTCGEGGALVTSDDALAARMHSLVNCGRQEGSYTGLGEWLFGYNARLTELQAAVLSAQLDALPERTERRAAGIERLAKGLAAIGGLVPLPRDERVTTQAAYQWVLRYDADAFEGVPRDRFLEALAAEGVHASGPFYVPLPDHPLMNARAARFPSLRERYGEGIRAPETRRGLDFPVASRAAYHEAVWLHHAYLLAPPDDQDRLLEAVAKVKRHAASLA
jgi:dTDP-4-amino-4,6-dideoxygalactose transaminase